MSHSFITLFLLLFLTSCASTTNHYTQMVASWRGGDARDLIERWGEPDNKLVASNGDSLYVYKTKSYKKKPNRIGSNIDVVLGDQDKPMIVAMPNINTTWNRGGTSFSCIAAFKADKTGKIMGTQTYGSGCYLASSMGNPNVERG